LIRPEFAVKASNEDAAEKFTTATAAGDGVLADATSEVHFAADFEAPPQEASPQQS
jgi:hypothetical protein